MRISDWSSDVCSSDLCGACVQACPTATLNEKKVIEIGTPDRAVVTTCAYCGVGCTFRAEMRGEELVRMVDRKSVVSGKSVSVRVDLGGRRILKKKKIRSKQ